MFHFWSQFPWHIPYRALLKTKNCDHVQPHPCTDLKTLLNSKVTQHLKYSKSIQSNSKTHISAKQRYLWINFSNVCTLQDSLSELGEIDGEETADVPENEVPGEG